MLLSDLELLAVQHAELQSATKGLGPMAKHSKKKTSRKLKVTTYLAAGVLASGGGHRAVTACFGQQRQRGEPGLEPVRVAASVQ